MYNFVFKPLFFVMSCTVLLAHTTGLRGMEQEFDAESSRKHELNALIIAAVKTSHYGMLKVLLSEKHALTPEIAQESLLREEPINFEEGNLLFLAVKINRLDIVKLLQEYGASVEQRSLTHDSFRCPLEHGGQTPVHYAARLSSPEIIALLLPQFLAGEQKCKGWFCDATGRTPLFYLAQRSVNDPAIEDLLVELVSQNNEYFFVADSHGYTISDYLVECNKIELFENIINKMLEKASPELLERFTNNVGLLHNQAFAFKKEAATEFLINKGVSLSVYVENGLMPVHYAALNSEPSIIRLFLKPFFADPSNKEHGWLSAEKRNPLYYLVKRGVNRNNSEVRELLIELVLEDTERLFIADGHGDTLLDHLMEFNLVRFFRSLVLVLKEKLPSDKFSKVIKRFVNTPSDRGDHIGLTPLERAAKLNRSDAMIKALQEITARYPASESSEQEGSSTVIVNQENDLLQIPEIPMPTVQTGPVLPVSQGSDSTNSGSWCMVL